MQLSPVFIGGAGRSGTTLVVDMLGLHPDLSPIYETSFVISLLSVLGERQIGEEALQKIHAEMDEWTRPLPVRPHFKREHEKFFHGPHYILFERPFAMQRTGELIAKLRAGNSAVEEVKRFILDLFADHVKRDSKQRWINKTPDYVLHLEKLRLLFPDLKFIHCVRDGRDVAASVMTRSWGPKTIEHAAQWWLQKVSAGLQFASKHPEQVLVVKYEDLIRHPADELRRMLTWIGATDQVEPILANYEKGPIKILGEDDKRPAGLSDANAVKFCQLAGATLRSLGY